jgi:hypothetical protein
MEQPPNNSWPITATDPAALEDFVQALGIDPAIEWQMETSEQLALLALLEHLRPEYALEVGSRYGGSMQILSRYAKQVISCDIDPTCRQRLGNRYPHVEFVTGPSQETLPGVLRRLQTEQAALRFMLIDGDHTAQGVRGDIDALIEYVPCCQLYVLLHDSFNPDVRRGIREARWLENPHVHAVELDFIPGVLHRGGDAHREMWGGLALAVLRPERRTGSLTISARKQALFAAVYRRSVHWFFDPPTLTKRAARKIRKLMGLKKSAKS